MQMTQIAAVIASTMTAAVVEPSTLDGLRAAITSAGRDPFSAPLLTAVRPPYRAHIEALK